MLLEHFNKTQEWLLKNIPHSKETDIELMVSVVIANILTHEDPLYAPLLSLLKSNNVEEARLARLAVGLHVLNDATLNSFVLVEKSQQSRFLSTTVGISDEDLALRSCELEYVSLTRVQIKALCVVLQSSRLLKLVLHIPDKFLTLPAMQEFIEVLENHPTLCIVSGINSNSISLNALKNNLGFFSEAAPLSEHALYRTQLSYNIPKTPNLVDPDDLLTEDGEIHSPAVVEKISKDFPAPYVGRTSKTIQRLMFNLTNEELPHSLQITPLGSLSVYYRSKSSKLQHGCAHLGKGVYGTVKLAKVNGKNKWVAVKTLKRGAEQSVKAFYADILNEVALLHEMGLLIAAYIRSNNNNQYEIIMKLVKGIALNKYVDANVIRASMSQSDLSLIVAKLALKAAQATLVLHKKGIVHRDLKLDNFVYDPNADKMKLVDLGLARRMNKQGKAFVEEWRGQRRYMPPEVFQDKINGKHICFNEKTDVYSLGLMYHALFICTNMKNPDLTNLMLSMVSHYPTMRPTLISVVHQLETFVSSFNNNSHSKVNIGFIDVSHYLNATKKEKSALLKQHAANVKHVCLMHAPDEKIPLKTIHGIKRGINYKFNLCEHVFINNGSPQAMRDFLVSLQSTKQFANWVLNSVIFTFPTPAAPFAAVSGLFAQATKTQSSAQAVSVVIPRKSL